MLRAYRVWDPVSPGLDLVVVRGVFGRLFKPNNFATISEAIAYKDRHPQDMRDMK